MHRFPASDPLPNGEGKVSLDRTGGILLIIHQSNPQEEGGVSKVSRFPAFQEVIRPISALKVNSYLRSHSNNQQNMLDAATIDQD